MSSVIDDTARHLYAEERLSIPQVSDVLAIPVSTVRSKLVRLGVELRSRKEGIHLRRDILGQHAKGKRRHFTDEWKANISVGRRRWGEENARGWRITPDGYIEYTTGEHKGRLEHDVLMEARLGRRLKPDEEVHHIDTNRRNNADNNLALLTKSGHMRLHRREDKLSGKIRERDSNGRFT